MKRLLIIVVTGVLFLTFSFSVAQETRLTNGFFPMSNCLSGSTAEQVSMVSETGGDGIFYVGGTSGIPGVVSVLGDSGLEVLAVYKGLDQSDLSQAIDNLEGTGAQLMVYVPGAAYDNEQTVIGEISALGELAAAKGVKVCIYPHAGFFVESLEYAVELAEKIDMENVGVTFNLCHSLRYYNTSGIDFDSAIYTVLEQALPYLFSISINGADADGVKWIQPLGEGTFDTFVFMEKLLDLGYAGPVALQCYGVPGDKKENLAAAMAVWEDYKSRLPEELVTGCLDSAYEEYTLMLMFTTVPRV